jgi:hypothetical protein
MITLPEEYPLGSVSVECGKRVGIKEDRWHRWVLQIRRLLSSHNSAIVDAIVLWKENGACARPPPVSITHRSRRQRRPPAARPRALTPLLPPSLRRARAQWIANWTELSRARFATRSCSRRTRRCRACAAASATRCYTLRAFTSGSSRRRRTRARCAAPPPGLFETAAIFLLPSGTPGTTVVSTSRYLEVVGTTTTTLVLEVGYSCSSS